VLPIDDRKFERFNPDLAGRPQLIQGDRQLLFGGMGRLSEGSIVSLKNKSHAVTAEVEVPAAGAEGVIVAQGGSVGGWSLYAKHGHPTYCYNFFGLQPFIIDSTAAIPSGKHQVRMEFKYDGGGLAKGGMVSLFIDGQPVGQGHVDRTVPMVFSADETCDVGEETGSATSPEYKPHGNGFTGKVHWVQFDVGADSHDHLITPEDRLNVALARQ
jgi:arylsulfatase